MGAEEQAKAKQSQRPLASPATLRSPPEEERLGCVVAEAAKVAEEELEVEAAEEEAAWKVEEDRIAEEENARKVKGGIFFSDTNKLLVLCHACTFWFERTVFSCV